MRDLVERSDSGLGDDTSLLRKTVSMSSSAPGDSTDATWNVELTSGLAAAPSEDLVLPAAEYPGIDAIDDSEGCERRYLWARCIQKPSQHLTENDAKPDGVSSESSAISGGCVLRRRLTAAVKGGH